MKKYTESFHLVRPDDDTAVIIEEHHHRTIPQGRQKYLLTGNIKIAVVHQSKEFVSRRHIRRTVSELMNNRGDHAPNMTQPSCLNDQ